MLKTIWAEVRRLLTGRGLGHAIDRNKKAADDLDSLLREVLKR